MRRRVGQMSTKKFWNEVKPASQHKELSSIARSAMPYLDQMVSCGKKLSSKKAVLDEIGRYLVRAKTTVKKMYIYMYGERGDKNEVPKRDRLIQEMDLLNIFLKPVELLWATEMMETAALALIKTFDTTDPHYQMSRATNKDIPELYDDDCNDSDSNSEGSITGTDEIDQWLGDDMT